MAASTTSLVLYDPQDASPEVRTVAGFMAGYSGRTREAYTLDLRTFCSRNGQIAAYAATDRIW